MTTFEIETEENVLWSNGWAFFMCEEKPKKFLPPLNGCTEWMKGFCAAMADYDLEPYREYQTIQEALHDQGILGDVLDVCLTSAESILNGDEWCRFPDVPIRS